MDKGQCARRRLKWPHAAFSSSAGGSPPPCCGLACNHFLLPPGLESFSGGKRAQALPTRRPGFVPSGEENTAGRPFRREKPRFPLSTEGSIFHRQLPFAMSNTAGSKCPGHTRAALRGGRPANGRRMRCLYAPKEDWMYVYHKEIWTERPSSLR